MKNKNQIIAIKDFIVTAEKSLKNAKKLLNDLVKDKTIGWNGRMMYKQIAPIERETKVGLLTEEKGKYQVLADWVSYDLLTAAVTHFGGNIWDNVTVIIPKGKAATFAAIDTIAPKQD